MQGTVSFGSGETQHDSSLSALGASSVSEIDLNFTGPFIDLDSGVASGTPRQWTVSCEVINATTVRFYRRSLSASANSSDLLAKTFYFNARRVSIL